MKIAYRWLIGVLVILSVGAILTLSLTLNFNKSANKHIHTVIIDEAVTATCTSAGLTEGKHCSTCDEIIVEQTEVPALGHDEVIDEAVAPGYPYTGLTEGKHCSRCDTVLVAQKVVNIPTYTVTWSFSGGTTKKLDGTEVSNRLSYKLMVGEPFTQIENPTFNNGYTFVSWCSDSALTTTAEMPETMPSQNVTFYAKRLSAEYTVTFDVNISSIETDLNISLSQAYLDSLSGDFSDLTYTVDQIISNGAIRLSPPTMLGFKFLGWFYEDDDGNNVKISNITRTTARNYDLCGAWEPLDCWVTLDTQCNIFYDVSSIFLTNFGSLENETRINGYDATEDDVENGIPEDFYLPVRPGFTFICWAFKNAEGEFIHVRDVECYDVSLYGQTLYAVWESNSDT